MVHDIIKSLEEIAKLAKSSTDLEKTSAAIQIAREWAKKSKLDQLDAELSTWQSKLEVIFKEPVGRQGMTKHAQHWAEKLKRI